MDRALPRVKKEPRILVVEDGTGNFKWTGELKKAGLKFQTHSVQDRQALLEQLEKSPPDLILSDYRSPAAGSFKVLQTAREKLPDVPIIYVAESANKGNGSKGPKNADIVSRQKLSELVPAVQRALKLAEERARRKEAEEALRKSEERYEALLQSLKRECDARLAQAGAQHHDAVKELENFSYSVSHDLRAPVRHIDGFTEMLQRGAEKELSEENRALLQVISDSSRLMGRMIDGILSYSRFSRAELKPEKLDMDDLVQTLAREIEFAHPGRKIQWSIQRLPVIKADRAALRHIFGVLMNNAVKFTQSRPEALIEIGAEQIENEIIFHVRDNGVGFNPEYAHKLFGIFQRLHGTAEFEGLGVGLACARRILTRLGGRIWAEAEEEKGACFYFALPK